MLIGGSAAPLNETDKAAFVLGAVLASGLWFIGIGFGARLLLPLFRRERVWQVLNGAIALLMWYLAAGLLTDAYRLLNTAFQTA